MTTSATPIRTADGVVVCDGMIVFTNEMSPGRVDLAALDSGGWFDVEYADGSRVMQNGERVATRFEGRAAAAEFDRIRSEQREARRRGRGL